MNLVGTDERTESICNMVAELPVRLEAYDDSLTAKLVKVVRVYPDSFEIEIL